MSTLLHWRTATRADVRERQEFTCALPAKPVWDGTRRTHPARYELQVQSWLRDHPVVRGETLLLGVDGDGIAAMAAWAWVDDPSDVLLQAVAVATRHRHRGGAHAREAIATALDHIAADAASAHVSAILVEGRIHQENQPSKALCAAHGFLHDGDVTPELERWVLYRPL